MEQAEKIMAANPMDVEGYHQTVNDAVTEIFEACSFQDLTGQRISKVVETLQHIERRVSKFADAVKVKDAAINLTEDEMVRKQSASEQLLHGPPPEGEGVSQDVVDQLLDSAPAAANAIDMPAAEEPGKAAGQPAAAEQAAAEKAAVKKEKAEDDNVAAAKARAAAIPKPELEELSEPDADKENSQDDINALFA